MFGGKPERIGSPSIGDVVRQGDLYLVCVENVSGEATSNRQLAPGETQGSRHVLSGDCAIFIKHNCGGKYPSELVGPAFRCDGDVTVEHPEHGHKILTAQTSWVVVYQRAFAEEIRRVRD
jgi:hypothetical protein